VTRRTRLTSKQRETLFDQETAKARSMGLGDHPICNICGDPIVEFRERWHESHDPHLPHALGGSVTGIAHERCNLEHNWRIDTPLVAKNKRIRQRYIGAKAPSRRPLPGGRNSAYKIKIGGGVEPRYPKRRSS